MIYETLKEAVHAWVNEMKFIPTEVVGKLCEEGSELEELTPPCVSDRIYVTADEYSGEYGEIIGVSSEYYDIRLDSDEEIHLSSSEFVVERESCLPMWGTMFTFKDNIDDQWLNGEYLGPHLKEAAECGFRIFDSEDFGLMLGIDGAGYDFYEAHWIPLYKARGLHWHKKEE